MLKDKNDEVRSFMKEEYKHTSHYKRKVEEMKINKLMGRIRKKAKGPNPLSVKKKVKREDGEDKQVDDEHNKAKKKRRRKKKNKESVDKIDIE
jgi:hypothetical protein